MSTLKEIYFSLAGVALLVMGCQSPPVEPSETGGDENVAEVEQALCASSCDCALGYACYDGACKSLAVFGPVPKKRPCYGDCQCSSGAYCDMSGGTYGYCAPALCGPCAAGQDCRCGDFCWSKNLACP